MRVTAEDDIAAIVRAAVGEGLTLLLDATDPHVEATTLAMIASLAIERAPMRVNLVLAAGGANPDDVEATIAFLAQARSTTGQALRVV